MAVPQDVTQAPESKPIALRLHGISKRFGELLANDNIGFDLRAGEVVALLGENGAGKTTLMNILFGHYVADEGYAEVESHRLPAGDPAAALAAGVGMVHQHFTLAENLTVLDNIVLGREPLFRLSSARSAARNRLLDLQQRFGLDVSLDLPISKLSVGERQRVEILKALYGETKVLILDEPTAVLTPGETERLFATLRNLVEAGLAVIFISHKLGEVLSVSDRVVVLRAGKVSGTCNTADVSRTDLAAMMVGREVDPPKAEPGVPGINRLALNNVSTSSTSHAHDLKDVSLDFPGGTITGIAGVSGNGQGSLADLVSGQIRPVQGTLNVEGAAQTQWSQRTALAHGIGRIPEDRHAVGTIADLSITENLISESYRDDDLNRNGFLNWGHARKKAEKVIADYDVKCPSPDAPIRLLSGGNMQKLILGRVLEAHPKFVLANQPSRGLDVGAVAYVHQRLLEARDHGAAILLISEDLDEIFALSDVIHVMFRGHLSDPISRAEAEIKQIGELMAGHGFGAEREAVGAN